MKYIESENIESLPGRRLKKQLDLLSDEFLDRYLDIVLRESSFFPDVLLPMSDNRERT